MKENVKEKYKKIFWIVLVVLLVGLLVLLAVLVNKPKNSSPKESTTISADTGAMSVSGRQERTSADYDQEGDDYSATTWTSPDDGRNPEFKIDGEYVYGGILVETMIPSISSRPQLYYFYNGKLDRTYTGICQYYDKNNNYYPTQQMFLVQNGIVDRTFTGFYEHDNFRYYIHNGIFEREKNGPVQVNGQVYQLARGIVQDDF